MQFQKVKAGAFPREGYLAVGSLGMATKKNIQHLVPVVGRDCLECGWMLKEGDLVTLVRDIYGVAWVHDACIREEVAA